MLIVCLKSGHFLLGNGGGSNKLPALDVNSNSTGGSIGTLPGGGGTNTSRAESARSRSGGVSSNIDSSGGGGGGGGLSDRLHSGDSSTTGYASGEQHRAFSNR